MKQEQKAKKLKKAYKTHLLYTNDKKKPKQEQKLFVARSNNNKQQQTNKQQTNKQQQTPKCIIYKLFVMSFVSSRSIRE